MKFNSLTLALVATSGVVADVVVETIIGCPALPPPTSAIAAPSPSPSSSIDSTVAPVVTPTTFSTIIAPAPTPTISSVAAVVPSESPVVAVPVPSSAAAAAPAAASPLAVVSGVTATGEATFYGGNIGGGTCSFTTMNTIPNNLFGVAFSGSEWNNAAACGSCVEISSGGTSITAMVVDECPECAVGHFDLFQNAFSELAALSVGILAPISYQTVSCGITTPIVLHSKSGSSQYFFSMQVVGANEGTASLEVSVNGGAYQKAVRQSYNFFETGDSGGYGAGSYSIRLTSASGKVVVVPDVTVASDAQTTATANY